MAAPSPVQGATGPPFFPGRNAVTSGTVGGSLAGPTVAAPQGICVAFDSATLTPNPIWTPITNYVQSYTIDRGRAYEFDKTQTGTARVTLIDTLGIFDPTSAGPYYGKLVPRKQAAIALQNPVTGIWTTLFRGFVDSWKIQVDQTERYLSTELLLVDAFDILAATEVVPDTNPTPKFGDTPPAISAGDVYYNPQNVDDRIRAALADAGWPPELSVVFSGNVSVRGTVYSPRSQILTVVQDAADAEFPGVANVYVSKDGMVTFHGRKARFAPENYQTGSPNITTGTRGIAFWALGDVAAAA